MQNPIEDMYKVPPLAPLSLLAMMRARRFEKVDPVCLHLSSLQDASGGLGPPMTDSIICTRPDEREALEEVYQERAAIIEYDGKITAPVTEKHEQNQPLYWNYGNYGKNNQCPGSETTPPRTAHEFFQMYGSWPGDHDWQTPHPGRKSLGWEMVDGLFHCWCPECGRWAEAGIEFRPGLGRVGIVKLHGVLAEVMANN